MTATPAAGKELNYMFAHIEDDNLVEDPDDPTDRKWVLLVSETPIMHAPSETLWDRVAECPPVEYKTGYWRVWESGPLPAPSPLIDPVSISVFIVPRSQYAQLHEARDKLTDLRVKNIFQRPQKAPSKGATASTFINDHKSNIDFGERFGSVLKLSAKISKFSQEVT
ncbi:hypothetical protein LENED_000627 [Lentinula edodes]|uniref:Uncharacterized protein n=1 Tax=Lentinula edodes TaxID=5353 RepID=A0A1Q3DW07_LENED|nr:hypothetical protein LENED_000627 [Lentinula edodes]